MLSDEYLQITQINLASQDWETMVSDVMGLKNIDVKRSTTQGHCSEDNGGCQHFCFSLPGGDHRYVNISVSRSLVAITGMSTFLFLAPWWRSQVCQHFCFSLPGGDHRYVSISVSRSLMAITGMSAFLFLAP